LDEIKMYTAISNFRFGLDSRRSELSSAPGSLIEALNGQITQGGTFQKRKAFVASTMPSGCYGAQPTSNGVYTFGSTATKANLPAPYVYQQITHPATDFYATINGVVCSTQYDDKPFIVASFTTGPNLAYYNGALVTDFTDGYVAAWMSTNQDVATNLVSAVNNSLQYTATQGINDGITHNENKFDTYSLPGASYLSAVGIAATAGITVSSNQDTSFTKGKVFTTTNVNAAVSSFVYIGGQKYIFKAAANMNAAYDVAIGASPALTLQNLFLAVNASGVAGTNYYTGTAANTNCYASNLTLGQSPSFDITAKTANTSGQVSNSLPSLTYLKEADTVALQGESPATGVFTVSGFLPIKYSTVTVQLDGSGTNMANTSTIVLAGTTFTFRNVASASTDVQIGASADATLQNLSAAVLAYYTLVYPVFNVFPLSTSTGGPTSGSILFAYNAKRPTGQSGNGLAATLGGTTHLNYLLADGTTATAAGFSGGSYVEVTQIQVTNVCGTGTLVSNGSNLANTNQVTVGGITYTFKTGALSSTNDIKIGATVQDTLYNLIQAINASGVQGADYNIAGAHTTVRALPSLNNLTIRLIARQGGATTLSCSSAVGSITASGAFTGGSAAVNLLSSAFACNVYQQSLGDFLAALVNAINQYSNTSTYNAQAQGNSIVISSVQGNSFSNQSELIVTTLGDGIAIGYCGIAFNALSALNNTPIPASNNLAHQQLKGKVARLQINGFSLNAKKHKIDEGAALVYPSGSGGSAQDSTDNYVDQLCLSLASDCNANQTTYTVVPVGSNVYVSKLVTSSADAPLVVSLLITDTADATTNVFFGAAAIGNNGLLAFASPLSVAFRRYAIGGTYSKPSSVDTGVAIATGVTGYGIARALGFGGFGKAQKKFTESFSPIVASCQARGGYPPYRYQWIRVSGDPNFQVSQENAASVTFSRPDTPGSQSSIWKCTVTDDLGNTIDSNTIKVIQP
jgi:hypothetical protein